MAQRTVQSGPFPPPPLPVTVTNDPLRISGTVTNDGSLAKESGGNLEKIAEALDIPLSNLISNQQHVIIDGGSVNVDGAIAITNADLTNLSVSVANSELGNLDVPLSTRTKPSDQQHTIIDSATLGTVNVAGTVTVDTSLLALESNGNLAAIKTDLDALINNLQSLVKSLGRNISDQSISVTLASDERIIPVGITDGSDTIGVASKPLRTDPTGTTPQPVNVLNSIQAAQLGNWIASVINTIGQPLFVSEIDGTPSDLDQIGNTLREMKAQKYATINMYSIQSGQFVPLTETLPFLST